MDWKRSSAKVVRRVRMRRSCAGVTSWPPVVARSFQLSGYRSTGTPKRGTLARANEVLLEADFRAGRRAAVEQCLTTALRSSRYPDAFPHKFALIYRSRDQELLVEYEFPRARDIIQDEASFRYVKSKEIIEAKPRTAADKQKLYKSVLAQITLRVLYELLTADLHEHVQRIAFNGVVDDIDPSTGRPTRPKLVSLRVGRAEFLDRDFSLIEPQPALRSLKANFSPAPTELRAVPPILEFDVNDPRFIEAEESTSSKPSATSIKCPSKLFETSRVPWTMNERRRESSSRPLTSLPQDLSSHGESRSS